MSLGRIERTLDQNGKTLVDEAVIQEIAKNHEKTPAQVLLRCQLQRGVLVIPKSATPSRIEENAQLFDFALSDKEVLEISKLNKPLRKVFLEKFIARIPQMNVSRATSLRIDRLKF